MGKHFSLSQAERQQEPVYSEMKSYKAWLTTSIQMDRAGKAVAPRTVENIFNHAYQYLGFLKMHMGRRAPSLQHYTDMEAFSSFLAFQVAKQNVYTTLSQQISSARKTLTYIATHSSQKKDREIHAIKEWLSRLSSQLSGILPKPRMDVGELQANNQWVEAEEVVGRFDMLRIQALQRLEQERHIPSVGGARLLHDAALTSCMFGYLAPLRLVALRNLQLPSTEGCLYQGCQKQNCQGNRLENKEGQLYMVLRHYKVDAK